MDTRVIRVQYSSISGAVLEYFGLDYWSISGAVFEYFGCSTAFRAELLFAQAKYSICLNSRLLSPVSYLLALPPRGIKRPSILLF